MRVRGALPYLEGSGSFTPHLEGVLMGIPACAGSREREVHDRTVVWACDVEQQTKAERAREITHESGDDFLLCCPMRPVT